MRYLSTRRTCPGGLKPSSASRGDGASARRTPASRRTPSIRRWSASSRATLAAPPACPPRAPAPSPPPVAPAGRTRPASQNTRNVSLMPPVVPFGAFPPLTSRPSVSPRRTACRGKSRPKVKNAKQQTRQVIETIAPNLRRTRVELHPWVYIHESTSSRSCGFLRPSGGIRAFSEAVFAAELANFFLWS